MKVRDLIEQLSKFDPELEVFVNGYEAGLIEPTSPREANVALNVNTEWYYGPHEEFDSVLNGAKSNTNMIKAILIER